jgi:adenylate cyclase
MSETRKIAAILVSDVVGYSRLAGADEDRILARLRTLRSDLIDPLISVHHGRIVKRTGDGSIIEFRSVVDAVRLAIEVQSAMVERNAEVSEDRRILFRLGIHLGDVVEESDGDLMGDGINIAARIESVCGPGGVCLSEDAYRQVKGRLDLAVTDLGPIPLKNIAEPIRVYSLRVGVPAQAKPAMPRGPPAPKKRSALSPLAAALVALLVLIAGGTWWFLNANRPAAVASKAPAEAARISLVVLPFTNLSNDPAQDYFADGVTENLTTDLSRIRNSFVIARSTAFTFKGKNLDAKAISKELGVRYVLEGSVQRDANRVRVNAQLIDAESGAHVWADRFEDDVVDLFKLQDDVVARLAGTLQVELLNAEAQRSLHDRPRNPDAIDLTMRGMALLNQPFTKASRFQARDFFEQALTLDPTNADALAGAAFVDMSDYNQDWSGQQDLYARAMQRAEQALLLNPDQPYAHYAKARLIMMKAKPNDAASANRVIAEAEATLRADPSFARAYWPMAAGEQLLGNYGQSISRLEQAVRISPRDSNIGTWHMEMGRDLLGLGRTDAAVQEGLKAIDSGYRTAQSYMALAAFHAAADKVPEAKAALAEAMNLNPKLSVAWLHAHTPSFIDSPPGFHEALIKAGLPEE